MTTTSGAASDSDDQTIRTPSTAHTAPVSDLLASCQGIPEGEPVRLPAGTSNVPAPAHTSKTRR